MPSEVKALDIAGFARIIPPGQKAPNFQTIYSNSAKIGLAPWDFRITFGQLIESATVPNSTVNEEAVTVVMSPQYAKQIALQWQQVIAQYEAAFGVIPDVVSTIEKAKQASAGSD